MTGFTLRRRDALLLTGAALLAADRVLAQAGAHDVEWLGARDAALLTLLYGAGLRISEALGLKRGDVPLAENLTVLGKGRKERSVPVLPCMRPAAFSSSVTNRSRMATKTAAASAATEVRLSSPCSSDKAACTLGTAARSSPTTQRRWRQCSRH